MKTTRMFHLKVLMVKFSIYLNRRVFVMGSDKPVHPSTQYGKDSRLSLFGYPGDCRRLMLSGD